MGLGRGLRSGLLGYRVRIKIFLVLMRLNRQKKSFLSNIITHVYVMKINMSMPRIK